MTAPENPDSTFEKRNGAESLAHAKAAQEANKQGHPIEALAEGLKSYGASNKYQASAVVDHIKALATPFAGKDDGRTR